MDSVSALRRGLFGWAWGHNLVYNQCWEDPAVDRRALRLGPADSVLVITSAGCNALDYALTGARVLAVDANPRQNYLLELKLAAVRGLHFEDFFELFGEGGSRRAAELYRAVRAYLSPAAAAFWDARWQAFDPARGRGGSFYYSGTAGLVALALRRYLERVARVRAVLDRILDAPRLETQLEIYRRELRAALVGRGLLKLLGSQGVLALVGVPAPQARLVAAQEGGFARFLADCLDRVMAVRLLRENYFWRVYLTGRYERATCPAYLERHNFARLKAGLIDNVRVRTATVTEYLAGATERFSAFVLLDHMDWLTHAPHALEQEWREIFAHAADGARVLFRSAAPDAAFLPPAVAERLTFDHERAAVLHAQDRVATYASFHIAHVAAA